MPDVHAILIAVETYQDTGLPAVAHAEASLRSIAELLRTQGVAEANLTTLSNTTKTATESKLRLHLKRIKPTDSLLLFFIGHVVSESAQNYLLAADAVVGDLVGTGLPLADVWDRLGRVKCPFTIFLDSGAIPTIKGDEAEPHLASDELTELPEQGLCFTASIGEEPSAHDKTDRLWIGLIREALSGKVATPSLTAGTLAEYLEREMPRVIRKSLSNPVRQTPSVFGMNDPSRILLKVKAIEASTSATTGIDLEQLKRVAFRAETTQRFKSLNGFQKGNKVPDQVSPYHEKFLAKIATDDIRSDIEEIYAALRENMSFKRKDLEASTETDGSGFIRTPLFDYNVQVRLDANDPSMVIWRREVCNLHDPMAVQSAPFQAVFGNTFDRLVFEFATPLDVGQLVDHIEESSPVGVKVRLTSDEQNCVITLDGFAGSILIDRQTLQIEGRSSQTSATLIQQFFEFQRRFSMNLDLKQLPLNREEE